MKRIHVRQGMKKVLAFSLAAAMVIPGAVATGSIHASAEEDLPKPAKYFSMDRGFVKEGLRQGKFGALIGMVEDTYPSGQYKGKKYFSQIDGRLTGQYKKVSTVLKQGSFKSTNKGDEYQKGYEQVPIPEGAPQQCLPDPSDSDGSWLQLSVAWNQPTTAYDAEKGMVFWLDDTLTNESYPTYATEVDWKNGTWDTKEDLIVKDSKGQYQEFEIINSAAEFDNPFAEAKKNPEKADPTGITFSAWIKNTTPYKAPFTYTMLGDLNGNGKVDTDDALMILKHLAKIELLPDKGLLYADVNGTGKVDADDALDILKLKAKIITEFKGSEPEIEDDEEEVVPPLKDSEFFHVERRVIGTKPSVELKDGALVETGKREPDTRDIQQRQYLYFSGNGITYVGDFNDPETACTWTLKEDQLNDETKNLLNGKNGSKWNYVSYTFDGEEFRMYLNGNEVELEKNAHEKYTNGIMDFVSGDDAITYLGGRGGGVKGNFNTYAIGTSADYYMDDVAVYTSVLSKEQVAQAYDEAAKSVEAAQTKKANVLMTYKFEEASLAANKLTATPGSKSEYLLSAGVEGKDGKGLELKRSYQSDNGGVQLDKNPFAGRDDLTGVTISYWIKAKYRRGTTVEDGVVFSFIDDEKECVHEKVGSAYEGENAKAMSQLYLNEAFVGSFCEGTTKAIGANSLKNIFNYAPYNYGNPKDLEDWKQQFEKNYESFKTLKNGLADDWYFITVTFNNSGFVMYQNGVEVKNRLVDIAGERFCDYYVKRTVESRSDITRKGGNNGGARSLMDFITGEDTKAYIGFAYSQGSSSTYQTSSECYFDELTFYDKDMTAAEVRDLYNSVK